MSCLLGNVQIQCMVQLQGAPAKCRYAGASRLSGPPANRRPPPCTDRWETRGPEGGMSSWPMCLGCGVPPCTPPAEAATDDIRGAGHNTRVVLANDAGFGTASAGRALDTTRRGPVRTTDSPPCGAECSLLSPTSSISRASADTVARDRAVIKPQHMVALQCSCRICVNTSAVCSQCLACCASNKHQPGRTPEAEKTRQRPQE